MKPLRLFAIVLALAIGFWAWHHGAPPGAAPTSEPEAATQPEPALSASGTADGPSEIALDASPAAPPLLEAPADTARERVTALRGIVLSALDGAGVPEIVVTVASRRGAEHSARSTVSTSYGAIDLTLVGDEWRTGDVRLAYARDATSGAARFEGLIRLDQDFVLVLEEAPVLRGVVHFLDAYPDLPVHVGAFVAPRRTQSTHRFVGASTADARGWFEFPALLPPLLEHVRMSVAIGDLHCASFDVPLEELTSPAGAHLFVEVSELRLHIHDPLGAPIADAEARVGAFHGDPGDFPPVARSDERGVASFRVQPGVWEVCVGKEGYASRVGFVEFDLTQTEYDYVLEPLEDSDELFGVVLLDTNQPVPRAFVSAGPVTHLNELSTPGITSVRSDEHGEFRFRAGSTAPLELTAFHRDWGLSTPQRVAADGRRLVIWLPRTGSLSIDVLTDSLPGPFRGGGFEYVLRRRADGEIEAGESFDLPFEALDLRAGEYDLFALLPGFGACAEGYVRVLPGEHETTVVAARAAAWIEGRVLDGSGAGILGLEVVAQGRWPREVAARMCSGLTDSRGSFRVRCDSPNVELSVSDERGEWARQSARAGTPVEIVLR